jgi:ribonuclease Y
MRIVGREGRNVRALEAATGVSVLIDDTPGVVAISAFDPVRRETARRALERLLRDGRIHPVAIDHAVQAAKEEMDALIPRLGEEVAAEAQVAGLSPRLHALLGRLEFLSDEGQALRRHALETARLAGALAGELGLDAALARRAGLIHDIGRAVASEAAEGGHAAAGADVAKREGEPEPVVRAIALHEERGPGELVLEPLAAVVRLANVLSTGRPGARSEEIERSIRRHTDLEAVAASFPGVAKAYAVQAGRELRVLVDPGQVTDKAAVRLAKDIAKAVEEKVGHPGAVLVTVVRETRATGTAK